MNPYYMPVDFSYDPKPLCEVAELYLTPDYEDLLECAGYSQAFTEEYFRVISDDGTEQSICRLFFNKIPQDFRHLEVFSDMAKLFSDLPHHRDPEYLYNNTYLFRIRGSLPAHRDTRSVGFNLPLRGYSEPCYWYADDGKTIVCEATYTGATLVNVHVNHGCHTNQTERLLFTVGGFDQDFPEVRDKLPERTQ